MNLELRRLQRIALLTLMTVTLAACGGGGDDDEEDVPDDEDGTGLWQGSFTQGSTSRPFNVMAAPNGQFFGYVAATTTAPTRFLVGTANITQNILNGTGTVIAPFGTTLPSGGNFAPLTVAAGRVTTAVSMTGNYNGGGEVATFSVNFDAKTRRGASLTTAGGTYTQTGPNAASTISITVSGGSVTLATGAGCNGTGTIQVIDPTINIYSWNVDIGVCGTAPAISFAGLGTIGDAPAGGTNNLLVLFGATAARDRAFVYAGTK